MKLLTEPFGFGTGDSVSLRTSDNFDAARLRSVLAGYSCYPPAVEKIIACLRASGRYDCTLQSIWFRQQHNDVRRDLAALGVELHITNVQDAYPMRWAAPEPSVCQRTKSIA